MGLRKSRRNQFWKKGKVIMIMARDFIAQDTWSWQKNGHVLKEQMVM